MISIRPERKEEFPAIYELVKEAFATAPVSDGDEQDFVNRLRAGKSYIPELALVAEEDGQLAGHIMLTEIPFMADKGGATEAMLLLAPLCVRLENRKTGTGAALVREAFKRARKLGYGAVFLLGDIAYYGRFGFCKVSDFGLRYTPPSLPDAHTLACELFQGTLQGRRGVVAIT